MPKNIFIITLIIFLLNINIDVFNIVNAAVTTKAPTRKPSRKPTIRPTPPGVPCVCNYGIGCYKNSNCCPGLYCSLNIYNPYAPGQCLELSQYTSMTGCFRSQTDYGCTVPNSNVGCCNPYATCGAKFANICDFKYNCTMNYISPHPSSMPSSAPSSRPSVMPSSQPSGSPTSIPSNPSSQPSNDPSKAPSVQPSSKPSQPSTQPTGQPISNPTTKPSGQPLSFPTGYPTFQPYRNPSRQPSSQPIMKPSSQPIDHPTCQPSFNPTGQPTSQPVSDPSGQPSLQPFSKPSSQPICQPTRSPTDQPTIQPSSQPFRKPSRTPSRQPSAQPSSSPSLQPMKKPYSIPTSQPSFVPTSQPTLQPVSSPTAQPSAQPINKPSKQPTSNPSNQPSTQPNRRPFSLPTSQPSNQPFKSPSEQPSKTPTSQPTSQPSHQPSRSPSVQPTSQPQSKPTKNPSTQPSAQPFQRPSAQPSKQPTTQPSSKPSRNPTDNPSRRPSKQPMSVPSSQPSKQPTKQPTTTPSRYPSEQPSLSPSIQPSAQPIDKPTYQPSRQPTSQPIGKPTKQPSGMPSHSPSTQPIREPSRQPTMKPSSQPFDHPTRQPSRRPSSQPSHHPTSQPSGHPSLQPISRPSSQPSRLPSKKPTSMPSTLPTTQPSSQPFFHPSNQPSSQPTNIPTVQPFSNPTNLPSLQPSNRPSFLPTTQPSSQPSLIPHSFPTSQPSKQPSESPSHCPTSKPSLVPSQQPTTRPTIVPTVQPSTQPSLQPSSRPTNQPSKQPSTQPSKQPYSHPSKQPNTYPSSHPSDQPSQQPVIRPSRQPTSQPLVKPSTQPSVQPTQQPFSKPSAKPSNQPTSQPIVNPTSQPTGNPTNFPSKAPSMQPSEFPTSKPSDQPSTMPTMQPIFFNSSYIVANLTTPYFDENYSTSFVYAIAMSLGLEIRNVEYFGSNSSRRSLVETYFSFPNSRIALSMAQYPQFKLSAAKTINFFVEKLNTAVYSGEATKLFISRLNSLGVHPELEPSIVAVFSEVGLFHFPTYSPTKSIESNGDNKTNSIVIFGVVFGFLGLLCIVIPSYLFYRNVMNKKLLKEPLSVKPKDDFAYGDLYSSNNEVTEKYLKQYISSNINLKTASTGGNDGFFQGGNGGFVQELALFDCLGIDKSLSIDNSECEENTSTVLSSNVEVGKMVSYDNNGSKDVSYFMFPMQTMRDDENITELPFPKSVDDSNSRSKIPFLTKLVKSNSTEKSATSTDNLQSWISIQPNNDELRSSSDSIKVEPISFTNHRNSLFSYFMKSRSDESNETKQEPNLSASVSVLKTNDDNHILSLSDSAKSEQVSTSTGSSQGGAKFFSQILTSMSQSSKSQEQQLVENNDNDLSSKDKSLRPEKIERSLNYQNDFNSFNFENSAAKYFNGSNDSNGDNDSVSQSGSLFRFLNDNGVVEEIDIFSLSHSGSNDASDFSKDVRYLRPSILRLSRSIGHTEDTNDNFNTRFVTPTYNENNSVTSSPSDLFLNFSSESSSDDNSSNYTIRRSEAQVRKAHLKKIQALSNRSSPQLTPPRNDSISIAEIPNKDDNYFNLAKSIVSPEQKNKNNDFMKELDAYKQTFNVSKIKKPKSPDKGFGKKENEVVDMLITSVRTVLADKDRKKKSRSGDQIENIVQPSIVFENEDSILRQLEEKNKEKEKEESQNISPSSSTSTSSRINRQPKSLLNVNQINANVNNDNFEFDNLDADIEKSYECEIFELIKGMSPERKKFPLAVKTIKESHKFLNLNSSPDWKVESASIQPPVSVKFKEIRHKFQKMIEDNGNPKVIKNIKDSSRQND